LTLGKQYTKVHLFFQLVGICAQNIAPVRLIPCGGRFLTKLTLINNCCIRASIIKKISGLAVFTGRPVSFDAQACQ